MAKGADDRSIPMSPPGVVSLVRQSVPEDTILCLDNGLYKVSNSLSNFPFRFKVAMSNVALTKVETLLPKKPQHSMATRKTCLCS